MFGETIKYKELKKQSFILKGEKGRRKVRGPENQGFYNVYIKLNAGKTRKIST